MKVAINARFLLPLREGLGNYVYHLADELSDIYPDHEFHLILDRKVSHVFEDRPNVKTHILGPKTRHPFLWYYWLEYRVPKLLKKIGADVFFSPEGMLSLNTDVPTLMTIHDLAYLHYPGGSVFSHRKYLEFFMSRYINKAERIICVSDFTRQDILKNFKVKGQKVQTIYNGLSSQFRPIDSEKQQEFREKYTNGKPYFLYVGSIHPRKNVKSLIEGFEYYKSVQNDNCQLILAGRMAWLSEDVQKALSLSPNKKDIIHLDHVNRFLPEFIASAEAMCYISLFEGFGLPVLEAMASGIPVITTKGSAMEEIGAEAGIYIDPMDSKGLGEKMIWVRNNKNVTESYIKNGINRSKEFNWRATAESIFEELSHISRKH